jgi:uncharacterized protein (UPF0335 family)
VHIASIQRWERLHLYCLEAKNAIITYSELVNSIEDLHNILQESDDTIRDCKGMGEDVKVRNTIARVEKVWTWKRLQLGKTADFCPLDFNECTALLGLITMEPVIRCGQFF